jgi:hypothetical protein
MSVISGYPPKGIFLGSHNLLCRMLLRLSALWRDMRERRESSHVDRSQLRELRHLAKRGGQTLSIPSIPRAGVSHLCDLRHIRCRIVEG